MIRYASIGLVLGVVTVFMSVAIVNALLGGIVTLEVANSAALNLWSVLGIVALYILLAIGIGEVVESAHREPSHKDKK